MMDQIDISSDMLTVSVHPFGATVVAVRHHKNPRNLVLGFSDIAQYRDVGAYVGAIVGPVANRVAAGPVTIGGAQYHMPVNEPSGACLHSGPGGLHHRIWKVADHSTACLRLTCTLPDGACGLPGRRRFDLCYRVVKDTFWIEIEAHTDRLTPLNPAFHPYWALGPEPGTKNHQLQVFADHVTPTGPDTLPTGQIATLDQHPLDFRARRPLPPTPALDLNYCLRPSSADAPVPAAELHAPDGTALYLATTAPGLQVYDGAFLPHVPGVLTEGGDLRPYGGIALEPQFWPDAPTHAAFPSILLPPDRAFRQVSACRIVMA